MSLFNFFLSLSHSLLLFQPLFITRSPSSLSLFHALFPSLSFSRDLPPYYHSIGPSLSLFRLPLQTLFQPLSIILTSFPLLVPPLRLSIFLHLSFTHHTYLLPTLCFLLVSFASDSCVSCNSTVNSSQDIPLEHLKSAFFSEYPSLLEP